MRNGKEEDEVVRVWNLVSCHDEDYLSDLKMVWQLSHRKFNNIKKS